MKRSSWLVDCVFRRVLIIFSNISRSSYILAPSDHRPIVPWLKNIRSNSGMGRKGGGSRTNIHKELVMGSKTGEISMITTTVHQIRGTETKMIFFIFNWEYHKTFKTHSLEWATTYPKNRVLTLVLKIGNLWIVGFEVRIQGIDSEGILKVILVFQHIESVIAGLPVSMNYTMRMNDTMRRSDMIKELPEGKAANNLNSVRSHVQKQHAVDIQKWSERGCEM